MKRLLFLICVLFPFFGVAQNSLKIKSNNDKDFEIEFKANEWFLYQLIGEHGFRHAEIVGFTKDSGIVTKSDTIKVHELKSIAKSNLITTPVFYFGEINKACFATMQYVVAGGAYVALPFLKINTYEHWSAQLTAFSCLVGGFVLKKITQYTDLGVLRFAGYSTKNYYFTIA
ncbi:MAG: hypothetical protein ACPGLV_17130 [Bacteroidia bacterium]